jgi:hypothetical protein
VRATGSLWVAELAKRNALCARGVRKSLSYPAHLAQAAAKTPAKSTKLPAVLVKLPADLAKPAPQKEMRDEFGMMSGRKTTNTESIMNHEIEFRNLNGDS